MNNFIVKRSTVPKYPIIKPIVIGFLVGAFSAFFVLIIAAFLMTLKDVPEWSLGVISTVATSIGSLVAGYFCAYIYKKQGLAVGALMGTVIFMLLYIIGILSGAAPFTLGKLAMFSSDLIFGVLGGIIGINKVIKRKF